MTARLPDTDPTLDTRSTWNGRMERGKVGYFLLIGRRDSGTSMASERLGMCASSGSHDLSSGGQMVPP
jgi:hypothetical protein